jgi:hypothetical protein
MFMRYLGGGIGHRQGQQCAEAADQPADTTEGLELDGDSSLQPQTWGSDGEDEEEDDSDDGSDEGDNEEDDEEDDSDGVEWEDEDEDFGPEDGENDNEADGGYGDL